MDIVTLGAALNGSAEYVNSHFKGGSNIQIVDNPDGTQTINASGEVSSEDTVARAEIAAIKDGETLDSFGNVETALATKADTSSTYTKTEVDTALSAKADSADVYTKTAVDTAMSAKADKSTTYTKTEVDTALGSKQDTISDLSTIRSGAALGATAVQPETGKGLSTNDYTDAEKTKLAGIAEGAEVNKIESIKVNNTTINPDANKVINITVPTTAADVSALPDTTKYAAALSLTINSSTYVITGQLKDQNGDNLGTAQTIDLPLESVVVGGSYNNQTKKVVLTLQNGNTIEFSVADLVSGLQTELSANNKLNPAYINYDSTHRAVSDTEKSTWNGKQNAIDNSHKLSADLVDDTSSTNKFATAAELEQIETNKNNILSQQRAISDGGSGYAIINGKRLYMTDTEPTTPPIGSKWLSDTLQTYIQENGAIGTIEQGSFDSRDGTESVNATRIRSTFATEINPKGKYTINASGVSDVVIYAYNSNNTSDWNSAASVTQWQALPYTFDTTTNLYLRFAFRKNSTNPDISPTDISNIVFTCQRWD